MRSSLNILSTQAFSLHWLHHFCRLSQASSYPFYLIFVLITSSIFGFAPTTQAFCKVCCFVDIADIQQVHCTMDDFTPIIDEVNSKVLSKKLLFTVFIPFILSHQIFRNQISEHRFRKIGQSQLLNQSIFGLVLSDNKLTASPIYACIQMEVAFVGLFYANICTTFAIYLKRRRTIVFILQPP